jgi:DNA-nicking Smr family endonuclease
MRRMKARALSELKGLRQQLRAQAQQQQRLDSARRQALAQEQARARAETDAFALSVQHAVPLAPSGRVTPTRPPVAPVAAQRLQDNHAVLHASLSDEMDIERLLETDDGLSFKRPELGPDVTRKLRKGTWALQGQLDLHGMRSDEARQALADFVRHATAQGWRCVRVIHGKGLGSPGRQPVLKAKVQRWLIQKREVLAWVQAKASEGGSGALVVLLAGKPRG